MRKCVAKHRLHKTILIKADPAPIVLTSEVNLLSFQRDLKTVVTGEFFRNTASGIRITSNSMADYKAIQNLLSHILHQRRQSGKSYYQALAQ
jgi:hypothetical protein